MANVQTSDLKQGLKLVFDNAPWVCQAVDFVKPGKGAAFYKIRVLNLLTGNTQEKTLRSGEKLEGADVSETDMEYLYQDQTGFVFMDKVTFEQVSVPAAAIGDDKDFLLENMTVIVTVWNDEPIGIKLPGTMTLEVKYTEPAVQGDTQSRVMKEAVLSTGAKVQVPTFIKIGDKVNINTETRQYTGRVNK